MPFPFSMRVTAAPDVLFQSLGGEAVLLNLKSELYLGLDEVGTRMWTVLHESPSIQAAYDTLLAEYDVDGEQLREDLAEFMDRLVERGLVEIGEVAAPAE